MARTIEQQRKRAEFWNEVRYWLFVLTLVIFWPLMLKDWFKDIFDRDGQER